MDPLRPAGESPRVPETAEKIISPKATELAVAASDGKGGTQPINSHASQAKAHQFSWSTNLADLFTKSFIAKDDDSYAYKLDNGSASTALVISKAEFNHMQASLKVYQNQAQLFQANTGIASLDAGLNPVSLALAQAYLDLEKEPSIQTSSPDRDFLIANLIARLTNKTLIQNTRTHEVTNLPFIEREKTVDAILNVIKAKLKLPGSTFRVIKAFDSSKFNTYKGPLLVLFPDNHHGLTVDEQEEVKRLHLKQGITLGLLAQHEIIPLIFREGPGTTSHNWAEIDQKDLFNRPIPTGADLAGRYLSNSKKLTVEIPGIESGNSQLFCEHVSQIYLKEILIMEYFQKTSQEYTAKNELEKLKNNLASVIRKLNESDRNKVIETNNQSLQAMIDYYHLDDILLLESQKIEDYEILLPKLKTQDLDQNRLKKDILALNTMDDYYAILRNREIMNAIRERATSDASLVLGSAHIPELISEEMSSNNPIPIFIVMHNETLKGQDRILNLTKKDGFLNIRSKQEQQIGFMALDYMQRKAV